MMTDQNEEAQKLVLNSLEKNKKAENGRALWRTLAIALGLVLLASVGYSASLEYIIEKLEEKIESLQPAAFSSAQEQLEQQQSLPKKRKSGVR